MEEVYASNTCSFGSNVSIFLEVKKYAEVVKKLADEFSATFVPLQAAFDEAGAEYGNAEILSDGVHPTLKGAVVLGNEWLKAFTKMEK